MKDKLLWIVVLATALIVLLLTLSKINQKNIDVGATQCKHENAECHWNQSHNDCCAGLSCDFWKRDDGHNKYKCRAPSPTPTLVPTATPTLEPTPTEVEPTPTEVQPTPEQPQESTSLPVFFGDNSAPTCGSTSPGRKPANPFVWRSGNDAIVQWVPTEGDRVNIYYYNLKDRTDAHAVRDVSNNGYIKIGYLGSKSWVFGIQQSNGCAGGEIYWIVDGNARKWVMFR